MRTPLAKNHKRNSDALPPLKQEDFPRWKRRTPTGANCLRGSCQSPRQHPCASDEVISIHPPHPFAMLPYGIVRYHGAPADLRDIPLGTMMHVRPFFRRTRNSPPCRFCRSTTERKDGNARRGSRPPRTTSCSRRRTQPLPARGKGLEAAGSGIRNNQGMIVASRESGKRGDDEASEETMTFDAATRIWRGREFLGSEDLIAEGDWPASGKEVARMAKPSCSGSPGSPPRAVFSPASTSRTSGWTTPRCSVPLHNQNETHKVFIRSRWMPAWVDAVEYGKFGRATVTATLFGGMDESLYADFKKGSRALDGASENTLKHWAGGTAGTAQMASRGPILDVTKRKEQFPWAAAESRSALRRTSSPRAFAPQSRPRPPCGNWPDVHVPRDRLAFAKKQSKPMAAWSYPKPIFFSRRRTLESSTIAPATTMPQSDVESPSTRLATRSAPSAARSIACWISRSALGT